MLMSSCPQDKWGINSGESSTQTANGVPQCWLRRWAWIPECDESERQTSNKHTGIPVSFTVSIMLPSDILNKVRYEYPSSRPRTGSSPLHSSSTPARLTLPINQRTREFTHSNEGSRPLMQMQTSVSAPQRGINQRNVRPMSQQIGSVNAQRDVWLLLIYLARNFAYNPPESAHTPTTSLSNAQTPELIRPSQLNHGKYNDHVKSNMQPQMIQHQTPLSQHPAVHQSRLRSMGPPPVPQARLGTPVVDHGDGRPIATSSRRFVPCQQQPSTSPQRFFSRPYQKPPSSLLQTQELDRPR